MSEVYTGGCTCGAIRFEIAGEPLFQNHCQCLDCQHKSGTGHGSYLTFPRQGVKQTGDATLWDMVGDSGNVKSRGFCRTCGSVKVYIGTRYLGTVRLTSAQTQTKQMRYLPFQTAVRTGKLTLRTTSAAPVRVDGLLLRRT